MEKEMTNLGKSGCVVISPEHPGRAEKFMSNKTSGPVKVKCESVLAVFSDCPAPPLALIYPLVKSHFLPCLWA